MASRPRYEPCLVHGCATCKPRLRPPVEARPRVCAPCPASGHDGCRLTTWPEPKSRRPNPALPGVTSMQFRPRGNVPQGNGPREWPKGMPLRACPPRSVAAGSKLPLKDFPLQTSQPRISPPQSSPPRVSPGNRFVLKRFLGAASRGQADSARFTAAARPLACCSISNASFCPSFSVRMPAFWTALMWTKISLPPASGPMKP
jgi:hypothetical protein